MRATLFLVGTGRAIRSWQLNNQLQETQETRRNYGWLNSFAAARSTPASATLPARTVPTICQVLASSRGARECIRRSPWLRRDRHGSLSHRFRDGPNVLPYQDHAAPLRRKQARVSSARHNTEMPPLLTHQMSLGGAAAMPRSTTDSM